MRTPLLLAWAIRCRSPTCCLFGTEDPDGVFTVLAELDGRYLSTQVAGGFTGRVIGLYAAQGTVRFDWFDYEPIAEAQA
jgi:xylan 1,4-beta-xylosidase